VKSQCFDVAKGGNFESHIKCYVDSSDKKSSSQILNQPFKKYQQVRFPRFLLSEYLHGFWFKFCLENSSNQPQDYVLTMGEVYSQEYHINSSQSGKYTVLLSQDKRLTQNAYYFDHKYLKINIKPKEKLEILVKVKDKTGQQFLLQPNIKTEAQEHTERLKNLYEERFALAQNLMLKSILAFVMIFVSMQYFFTRYKFLLYYALYLLGMLLFHLYGFSFSSYYETPFTVIPFFKFELRQNFYVIITQIFYMLFLREFLGVYEKGSSLQKAIFKYQHYLFLILLILEILCSVVLQRLDFELIISLVTQFIVVSISIYLLITMFTSKHLKAPLAIRLASLVLFVGVIIGFLSATFEWVKTTSPLLQYYPNYFFNFCVLAEVFLYSLAIGQLYFKTVSEKSFLNQKIALSELNMLRSQINPHFLFNSLNSIKSLVIRERKHEAASFLTEFSALIRNILQKSREQFLNLEEELSFTESYLKIEKKRFDDGFEYEINVQESLLEKLVPAFILQPFVENSIKHGFHELSEKGKINIEISEKEEHIHVQITDNGIGRSQSARIKLSENGHQSFGTQLILDRLKILNDIYGWKIAFEIIDLEKGTKVVMTIPFFD
jgi:sensor histidine kinase YesM